MFFLPHSIHYAIAAVTGAWRSPTPQYIPFIPFSTLLYTLHFWRLCTCIQPFANPFAPSTQLFEHLILILYVCSMFYRRACIYKHTRGIYGCEMDVSFFVLKSGELLVKVIRERFSINLDTLYSNFYSFCLRGN